MTQPTTTSPSFRLALSGLCLASACLLAWPALGAISRIWSRTHYFGHGYLIPLVSLLLVYQQRAEIAYAYRVGAPPRFGWVVVGLAASFEVLALVGDVMFAAGLGIPTVLLAATYAIGGRGLARESLLPIGFLALMVPPPGSVVTGLLVDLKLLVTQVSVRLLQAFDFTVAAEGNQILVPGHVLFVADACSGLTSIITLIPLAFIVAYFLSHGWWRRGVVIASLIPLALLANVVRVTATVALVESQGVEFAQGMLHESFGVFTYVVGTMVLIGVARVLR